jgi:glucokinase
MVLDGVPFVGARGLTGTCASSRGLIPDDDGSLTGGPPLEQYGGGPAIAARFAAAGGDATMTAREIVALAASGDQLARTLVGTAGEALGAAIGQMVKVLDPEIVVLGGGLGLAGGLFRESIEQSMRRSIWSDLHRDLPLASAQLGPDAGFIGAALAAVERCSQTG